MKTRNTRSVIKKMAGALMCLMAAVTVMTALPTQTKAASVTWNNVSASVSKTNAVVRIRVNAPGRVRWTQASGTIYDENWNRVARKTERTDISSSYMNIWYDIREEMGVSLKPNTKYIVRFTATYGGMNFESKYYSFRTAANTNSSSKGDRINAFISDSRWINGASWGDYQRPLISTYDSRGCCAYCADYVKYVYGSNNLRCGQIFFKTSEIKEGDVLHVSGHWLVVLNRTGNSLCVAEGNVIMNGGHKVHVSNGKWTIHGNSLKNKYESSARTLVEGYHY